MEGSSLHRWINLGWYFGTWLMRHESENISWKLGLDPGTSVFPKQRARGVRSVTLWSHVVRSPGLLFAKPKILNHEQKMHFPCIVPSTGASFCSFKSGSISLWLIVRWYYKGCFCFGSDLVFSLGSLHFVSVSSLSCWRLCVPFFEWILPCRYAVQWYCVSFLSVCSLFSAVPLHCSAFFELRLCMISVYRSCIIFERDVSFDKVLSPILCMHTCGELVLRSHVCSSIHAWLTWNCFEQYIHIVCLTFRLFLFPPSFGVHTSSSTLFSFI